MKYKAIIFDFDGVILDSAHIKTDAFRELFSQYPQYIDRIMDYHMHNMGVSRYKKFRHFYEMMNMAYTDEKGEELSLKFSETVLDKILNAPYIPGIMEFLENNRKECDYFIATGTPEQEILYILDKKKLGGFFKEVYGSPSTKPEIINKIINNRKYEKNDMIFFGDAMSDYKAATECGINFIGIGNFDFPGNTTTVPNFENIDKILKV